MSSTIIPYHIVDAYATDGPFTGNQAPVIITASPLSSGLMQNMAREFNADSAFAVPHGDDPSMYSLKWFNPDSEVDICGHATLATAHILFDLPETRGIQSLTFHTRSGVMKAAQTEDGLVELDFPADDLVELQGEERSGAEKAVTAAIRGQGRVKAIYLGRWYLTAELVMDVDVDLANVDVDPNELLGLPGLGVILTTETGYVEGARFHSRYFNPGKVLLEETATGSAHCSLGVIYAPRFDAIGKPMTATQGPRRRQGRITVIWDGKSGKEGGRMKLRGRTVTVARGGLFV